MRNEELLAIPAIYPIADLDALAKPLEYLEQLLHCSPGILQLRAKSLSIEEIRNFTERTIEIRNHEFNHSGHYTKIIVNDHPDICLESDADGLHIGQEDTPVEQARAIIGPQKLLGLSTHTIEQVRSAQQQSLDYLGFGPLFESSTKQGHAEVIGLENLHKAVSISSLPIVAIGGISLENLPAVLKAGKQGKNSSEQGVSAAIISDLAQAPDLKKRMAAYREIY